MLVSAIVYDAPKERFFPPFGRAKAFQTVSAASSISRLKNGSRFCALSVAAVSKDVQNATLEAFDHLTADFHFRPSDLWVAIVSQSNTPRKSLRGSRRQRNYVWASTRS